MTKLKKTTTNKKLRFDAVLKIALLRLWCFFIFQNFSTHFKIFIKLNYLPNLLTKIIVCNLLTLFVKLLVKIIC